MRVTSRSMVLKSLLLGCMLATSVHARHRAGNGGHSVASHFSTIANNISLIWQDICLNKKNQNAFCEYTKDFKDTLDKDSIRYIKIKAEEEKEGQIHTCKIDNTVREACNNGRDSIIVNATAWKKIDSSSRLINLVLHEIFSVMELDSSDHYKYSMEMSSMLKRKSYDFDLLAAFEVLPNPCSIKITEDSKEDSVQSTILPGIKSKSYSIKDNNEYTRYDLMIASKCDKGIMSVSCGVYSQLKDNYTGKNIFTDMQVASGVRKKANKLFEGMKDQILQKMSTCNM